MIPVLKSDNVVLRGFTFADFPAFAQMWADPALTPFVPFAPMEPAQSWGRFNINIYSWCQNGFGNWAVVDPDGVFLGVTGFFRNRAAGMGADYDNAIQSGWVFAKSARGRGVASQAVAMAHDWLDAQDFGGFSACGMVASHAASVRIAEKCGYRVMALQNDKSGAGQTMKRYRAGIAKDTTSE